MNRPEIQAFLSQRRQQNLKVATLRASRKAQDLVDHESGHVSFRMVERLLETSGDLKMPNGPNININNNNIAAGYVIELRTDEQIAADNARVIEHEATK